MTKEIQIPSRDIAIQVSDSEFKPYRKKPTLAIRKGNKTEKVASFNNWDSALYFFNTCCDMFGVKEQKW